MKLLFSNQHPNSSCLCLFLLHQEDSEASQQDTVAKHYQQDYAQPSCIPGYIIDLWKCMLTNYFKIMHLPLYLCESPPWERVIVDSYGNCTVFSYLLEQNIVKGIESSSWHVVWLEGNNEYLQEYSWYYNNIIMATNSTRRPPIV